MTQRALTSVLCHEALHNLARRQRVGNPFLAEDTEHIAMALLGDPQLVHDTWRIFFLRNFGISIFFLRNFGRCFHISIETTKQQLY